MAEYEAYKDSGFEWLGNIPVSWPIVLLSQIVTQVKNKNSDLREQNLLSLSYGRIKRKPIDTNGGLLPESFDGYNVIEANDIVLRLTDLQNDHRSLRVGLATERGIITSAYTTMRPRNSESAKYLYYLLHTFDIRKGFYGMGSGVRQGLNYDEVKKLKLPLPTIVEQEAIAAYLDRETERIDAIIVEAKASIEEYKAWKASIIYEAVTKGLDPDTEMKDSGVEWIGHIPNSWEVIPFTKGIASIVDYRGKTPEKVSEGVFLVTARNIKDGVINYALAQEYVKASEYEEIMRRGRPEIGDVLFTTEAPLGEVANVDRTDFALAQRVIKFRAKPEMLDNYYLKYWIMSAGFQQNLYTFATGSTAKGIKASKLGQLKVVCPPLDEQRKIVRYLDSKWAEINALIAEKEMLISDMEAYKKSLIFEVVTGKRKVV